VASSARVQKLLDEAATFSAAERAELAAELSKPLVFTKEDMERQREAVLEFLAIPTFAGPDPKASEDKYAFLAKRDVEV
jgi:hypothetical protein